MKRKGKFLHPTRFLLQTRLKSNLIPVKVHYSFLATRCLPTNQAGLLNLQLRLSHKKTQGKVADNRRSRVYSVGIHSRASSLVLYFQAIKALMAPPCQEECFQKYWSILLPFSWGSLILTDGLPNKALILQPPESEWNLCRQLWSLAFTGKFIW